MNFMMENARQGFPELIQYLLDAGTSEKVDGHLTYEIQGAQIELQDPLDALPVGLGIPLDIPAAVDGLLALLSGESNGALHGSYGGRVLHQLRDASMLIASKPDTRQAVTYVGDPMYDRSIPEPTPTLDVVFGHQFLYRRQELNLHVFTRSHDVMKMTTALFQMGQLLVTMQNVLAAPKLGSVFLHIGSLHLYSGDSGIVDYIKVPTVPEVPEFLPRGIEVPTWDDVVVRSRYLRSGSASGMTPTEEWYLNPPV